MTGRGRIEGGYAQFPIRDLEVTHAIYTYLGTSIYPLHKEANLSLRGLERNRNAVSAETVNCSARRSRKYLSCCLLRPAGGKLFGREYAVFIQGLNGPLANKGSGCLARHGVRAAAASPTRLGFLS